MTNFKTALAGLRASIRTRLHLTSGVAAPVTSEPMTAPTLRLVAATPMPAREVREAGQKSRHIRCLKPTQRGTACGKYSLVIDASTYASGCAWHVTEAERQLWYAARHGAAMV